MLAVCKRFLTLAPVLVCLSAQMERLLGEDHEQDTPAADSYVKRVILPPSRVAMLPRLDYQNPSDSSHPWQIKPSKVV